MPKLLTEKYLSETFFIPYKPNKSEGVWVKPLSKTDRNTIYRNAMQEAGHDSYIADELYTINVLRECIVNWVGFFDAEQNNLPYSRELIKEMYDLTPMFFKDLCRRIENVASFGEVDHQKN